MTSHPIAVNMHMSKDEAAETMRKHKLHHLLVTDDEGKFYGLISSYDIARDSFGRESMAMATARDASRFYSRKWTFEIDW